MHIPSTTLLNALDDFILFDLVLWGSAEFERLEFELIELELTSQPVSRKSADPLTRLFWSFL